MTSRDRGSDGGRSNARTTATGFVLVGLPPTRRTVGASGRASYARDRPRQLSAEERAAVHALARTKSLRSLAADFGVSHETVRRVLREAEAAVAWREGGIGPCGPGAAGTPVHVASGVMYRPVHIDHRGLALARGGCHAARLVDACANAKERRLHGRERPPLGLGAAVPSRTHGDGQRPARLGSNGHPVRWQHPVRTGSGCPPIPVDASRAAPADAARGGGPG